MDRFAGFADLYDANRPTAPEALGDLLRAYAGMPLPEVVDLGSGTGLSTRWAARWASSVIGVEPSADMRLQATTRGGAGISYVEGTSSETGLRSASADVVVAVQAMHWMEPVSTLAEVARILRPGGVFATVDADWPPVSGVAAAEQAWVLLHRRIRVLEARAARGDDVEQMRRPVAADDPSLDDDDLHDPHRNRAMPGGVRSWPKSGHLGRIVECGHFRFVRELLFNQPTDGGADRFVALMRSQGSYQGLRRLGLDDIDIGADVFETEARAGFAAAASPGLSFSWRVRLGVA